MICNARQVIIDAGAPRPSTKFVAAIAHLMTSEDEPVEIGEIKTLGAESGQLTRSSGARPRSPAVIRRSGQDEWRVSAAREYWIWI
jgi:hypothetical protein